MKIKGIFKRIISFIKKHKYSFFIIFVAVLVSLFLIWDNYSSFSPFEPEIKLFERKRETKVRAPLSGELVSPEAAKRRPIAVVIENHPNARPQAGLNKASLVYETLAEGGITRFLAVFQENDAKVGPIRSARTEFVYWAKELEAIFAHAGGSADALELIKKLNVLDFNEFRYGTSFWRDPKRFAPHNLYSTTEKLRSGAKRAGYSEEKETEPFKFKDDEEKEKRPERQSITIDFSGANYRVSYIYDREKNNYKRVLAGTPHIDKISGDQLSAKNIIIQFTTISEKIGGDAQVKAVGSGKIKYFRDGMYFDGRWEKKDAVTRTKYFDQNEKEIELNAGTTWIEVVRVGTSVTVD